MINFCSDVDKDWRTFTDKSRTEELNKIISEENLKHDKTITFINNAFRDGELKSTGQAFADILPSTSMFCKQNTRGKKKAKVFERLKLFFEKYLGI